jgi:pSer/pThr/pTyr-binding forkhead associated (FHA) protein
MVLVEDMVSRRHAKITTTDTDILIQDVGSTNGTFVNGEKISGRARLAEGDRILVGTSIIKVVAVDAQTANQSEAEARRRLGPARRASPARPVAPCRASSKRFRCPTCCSCCRHRASRAS